ncbi:MAG: quinate 5-dehydrogenase [Bacillota bacterium]
MRRVVSVSLGSSKRNHAVETELLGQSFNIERIGCDGDVAKAVALIKKLDGQVDCFGMGGTDIYLVAGKRRYTLRAGLSLARAAVKTPIVDGSGIKNSLQAIAVRAMKEAGYNFAGKKALVVAAIDAFGLVEALQAEGVKVVMGDLIFTIGVPVPIHTLAGLDRIARLLAPIICRLPMSWIYPTGEEQDKKERKPSKYAGYYDEADIISGDWHYIKKHMPERLPGKTVITNTITKDDVALLKEAGVEWLVTTTPELQGRSFGTNVIEAILVTLIGKPPRETTTQDYLDILDRMGYQPRIERLV